MIKKIKFSIIFVNEEKTITSKKDGKVYKLCEVNAKVADDCPNYTGKYMKISFFEYNDPKDSSKNKTATARANNFKDNNVDKEILVDVTERTYVNKDKEEAVALDFKLLTKAQREVAEQFVK